MADMAARVEQRHRKETLMVALIVLLLILVVLGGLGFAAHVLWFVLIGALVLWLIGFFFRSGETASRRRGWYRW
jgi:1,4-dihydroxy-2-naphthoate octaprenyltransferase